MDSRARFFALLLSAFLPLTLSLAQEAHRERPQRDQNFWDRFEDEIERFVDKITNGFRDDVEKGTPLAADSGTVRSVDSNSVACECARSYSGVDTIGTADVIHGNVVVNRGELTVFGVVDGDIDADKSTVVLKPGSTVTGNVRLVDGDVVRSDGATVSGYIDHRTSARDDRFNEGRSRSSGRPTMRLSWTSENTELEHLQLRYNRVEGLFLGLGSEKRYYWDGQKDFSVFGSVGYGFSFHRWRGNLGVARQFPFGDELNSQIVEVGLEGYSLTDTKDTWLIPLHENSLAAFLIHEDFRDYFTREGGGIHAAYYRRTPGEYEEVRLTYLVDRYSSLVERADWALFGGEKVFRPNPSIDDGRMRSIQALIGFSTAAPARRYGPTGWSIHATAEFSDPAAFGGDFTFHRYVADVRRYQPLGRYDNLNLRLRVGTSHGSLPRQKSFELGGLGTLPGLPFKSMPGDTLGANRMILLNVEYIVNGDFLGDLDFWPSGLMKNINLVFLADAGLVRTSAPSVSPLGGFNGIRWSELRSDWGVGLTNRTGTARFALMWRTDRRESARVMFRITAPF